MAAITSDGQSNFGGFELVKELSTAKDQDHAKVAKYF
jgi:hypothetical protein